MHQPTLIALYDATPELSTYADPDSAKDARSLGEAIGTRHLGAIARIEAPLITAALCAVEASGSSAIALSPAASQIEHERAFRLPSVPLATIYTGRGALGADVAALESASAAVIIGSNEEALLGILGCVGDRDIPVGILSQESAPKLRSFLVERYPQFLHRLVISDNPAQLMQELQSEIRKRHVYH